jgi:hypothetical protein
VKEHPPKLNFLAADPLLPITIIGNFADESFMGTIILLDLRPRGEDDREVIVRQ